MFYIFFQMGKHFPHFFVASFTFPKWFVLLDRLGNGSDPHVCSCSSSSSSSVSFPFIKLNIPCSHPPFSFPNFHLIPIYLRLIWVQISSSSPFFLPVSLLQLPCYFLFSIFSFDFNPEFLCTKLRFSPA